MCRDACDGTVYAWHYCYYPENRHNNLQATFGTFWHTSEEEEYELRSGSYFFLQLDSQEVSFACGTVTLSPSEYFQIYEGDIVGACLRDNGLNVIAEDAPNSTRVAILDTNSCQRSDMSRVFEVDMRVSTVSLHLYVDIGELILHDSKLLTLIQCRSCILPYVLGM